MKIFVGLLALLMTIMGGIVLLEAVRNMQPDALGMGVGLLLGMLAGLPTMLLVIASAGLGRGEEHPPTSAPARRIAFVYESAPTQPTQPTHPAQQPRIAQRQPGTAVTIANHWQNPPVVYYREEVGDDWCGEEWRVENPRSRRRPE